MCQEINREARRSRRCRGCQCSPLPRDADSFWGAPPAGGAQQSEFCQSCRARLGIERGAPPHHFVGERGRAVSLCYVPKFTGRTVHLGRWLVPEALQVHLRWNSSQDLYITDGERVWHWESFPATEALVRYDFALFSDVYRIRWITRDRPPLNAAQALLVM